MLFEWDPVKCRTNLAKHRVDFADAVAVFEDPLAISIPDLGVGSESRLVALGQDAFGRILVVCYTERGATIRIISARVATRLERRAYEG